MDRIDKANELLPKQSWAVGLNRYRDRGREWPSPVGHKSRSSNFTSPSWRTMFMLVTLGALSVGRCRWSYPRRHRVVLRLSQVRRRLQTKQTIVAAVAGSDGGWRNASAKKRRKRWLLIPFNNRALESRSTHRRLPFALRLPIRNLTPFSHRRKGKRWSFCAEID